MRLTYDRSHEDNAYFVVNRADAEASLNSVAGQPEALQNIRAATVEILLARARNAGDTVVKVTMNKPPCPAVKGYVTFLSQIAGSDLASLERKLGFRPGVLQQGAYVYSVDGSALHAGNIAPRGNSNWSAGVSPRDLDNLTKQVGAPVGYHKNYPPALDPVLQFTVLEPVPYVGAPRFVGAGDRV